MKKFIAYSLWGDNPKYTEGAVINARQALEVYPGWAARFYCGESVPPNVIHRLKLAEAEVIPVDDANDNRGMFWRLWALADEHAERVILRDTDSRLSARERAAVEEWEQSGLAGHVMRDHPFHGMPMMGGMWGCKGGIFPDIKTRIRDFNPTNTYNQDQIFLEKIIYPELMVRGCCIHDEFFFYETERRPFPTPRRHYEFVGEAIGADGKREDHWLVLRVYEQSRWRRFRFACKRRLLSWRLHFMSSLC